jgi:hypothetical protein
MWMMGSETTSVPDGAEAHPENPAQSAPKRVARVREATVRRDASRLMGLLLWREYGKEIRIVSVLFGGKGNHDR